MVSAHEVCPTQGGAVALRARCVREDTTGDRSVGDVGAFGHVWRAIASGLKRGRGCRWAGEAGGREHVVLAALVDNADVSVSLGIIIAEDDVDLIPSTEAS